MNAHLLIANHRKVLQYKNKTQLTIKSNYKNSNLTIF